MLLTSWPNTSETCSRRIAKGAKSSSRTTWRRRRRMKNSRLSCAKDSDCPSRAKRRKSLPMRRTRKGKNYLARSQTSYWKKMTINFQLKLVVVSPMRVVGIRMVTNKRNKVKLDLNKIKIKMANLQNSILNKFWGKSSHQSRRVNGLPSPANSRTIPRYCTSSRRWTKLLRN